MIQEYNTYRALQLFFDYPTKKFYLREICRRLNLGMPSVRNHIRKLEKKGFIKKETDGVYGTYVSTRNEIFKLYKKNDILIRLQESGLLDFLSEKFVPNAIVLFGSASRGEDIEESDIDLLVVSEEMNIDIKQFEKKLNRKISIHFEPNISSIPKELLNNIINGIVIQGYLKAL